MKELFINHVRVLAGSSRSLFELLNSLPDTFIDKKTGFIIKQNNLEDIVGKILYLLNNRDVLKMAGDNAYELSNKKLIHPKFKH